MRAYITYLGRSLETAFTGSSRYRIWLIATFAVMVWGLSAYGTQWTKGLSATGMTDQISWSFYIGNFTFLVGVAAAAVMLVIPAYVYGDQNVKQVVLVGEILATVAIVMCLCFVTVDMGRPERVWHMLPIIGKPNWPRSLLSWDVVVLSGYLILNMYLPAYLLYRRYQGRKPTERFYIPFVFLSVVWAISIHTVTAFLYNGLAGRPFWNAAIIAPRFLASAFAAGPALIIIILDILRRNTAFSVPLGAIKRLKQIFTIALLINLFLLFCELFKEFYTDSEHLASTRYLWLGLRGYHGLVPWIWSATGLNLAAAMILIVPRWAGRKTLLLAACVMAFVGIWIEKGPGLIIPGFLPTPLGEMTEYYPTLVEIRICFGIWALGAFLYTLLLRTAVAIELDELTILGKPLRRPLPKGGKSPGRFSGWDETA